MRKQKAVKAAILFCLLQLVVVIGGLAIQKIISIAVKYFKLTDMQEFILLLILFFLIGFLLYKIFKQLVVLVSFLPLSDNVFSDSDKEKMIRLMQKIKDRKELNETEKKDLQYYVNNSVLPADFVEKHTQKGWSMWSKLALIVTAGYIIMWMNSVSEKKNVQQ